MNNPIGRGFGKRIPLAMKNITAFFTLLAGVLFASSVGMAFSPVVLCSTCILEDSSKIDTVKQIDYFGLSKRIVEYLEGLGEGEQTKDLALFLRRNMGVSLEENQAKMLTIVSSFYGLADIAGDSSNQQIIQFFRETNHPEVLEDEMSWCSVFLGWCAQHVDLEYTESSLAKSWLQMGEYTVAPGPGDIVVFWREKPNSWQGHVSLFLNEDLETQQVFCLGGNQDDKVCVRSYPSHQVLGYRKWKPRGQ
jgi:uncharacterized protein (TIGR02594 family)